MQPKLQTLLLKLGRSLGERAFDEGSTERRRSTGGFGSDCRRVFWRRTAKQKRLFRSGKPRGTARTLRFRSHQRNPTDQRKRDETETDEDQLCRGKHRRG